MNLRSGRVFERKQRSAHGRRLRSFERQAERVQQELRQEIERVRRSFKAEMVVYQPPSQALASRRRGVRVPIQRSR